MDLDNFILPSDAKIPEFQTQNLGNGIQRHVFGNDRGLAFRFFIHAEPNDLRSKAAKVELHDDIEMIEYFTDKKTRTHEMVTDYHRNRYPEDYKRFQEGREATGTPLSKWEMITPGQIASLVKDGIFSVEQYANLSTDRIQTRYPTEFVELHEKAQRHVAAKSGLDAVKRAADEMIELQRAFAAQKEEMEELKALLSGNSPKKGKAKPIITEV